MLIETLIFILCVELIPIAFGLLHNWYFLPKGSTVEDLFGNLGSWSEDSNIIPIFLLAIPGLNVAVMALVLIMYLDYLFILLMSKSKAYEFISKLASKIKRVKVK